MLLKHSRKRRFASAKAVFATGAVYVLYASELQDGGRGYLGTSDFTSKSGRLKDLVVVR